MTCVLKTLSGTVITRKGMFDVDNLTKDQFQIITASLQSDSVMIVGNHCKGNINKLNSAVNKKQ